METSALQDGDPGGVIAAIFQSFEPLKNDAGCLLFADVTDDSAHSVLVGLSWRFLAGFKSYRKELEQYPYG
jgi:hypothetical protein